MPINFLFNTQQTTRLINAICANRGYTDFVDDETGKKIPNPLTKPQFAKKWLRDQMEAEVRNYEETETARIARSGFTGIGSGD